MASIPFCPNCNNMFYIAIEPSAAFDAQPTLKYYCKNCGTEDRDVSNRVVLSKTNKKGAQDFSAFVNKYTKLDPTLPTRFWRDVCKCRVPHAAWAQRGRT